MLAILAQRRVWLTAAVVGGLLAVTQWPETLDVDVAPVTRGPLVVTIDEEGRTRVRDRFVVSSPVGGRVLRIELEPGDRVARGAVLARVRPEAPPLLDARVRAEAQAAAESARAALGRARAEEERARAALAQAERELARSRRLVEAGVLPTQDMDLRATEVQLAHEALEAAAFAARAAAAEVTRAEARLAPASRRATGGAVAVTAPAAGVVLRRLRESESVIPAGEPLVEIGDPANLEIVVDLLSSDAARIREGARADVELSGQRLAIDAVVRRIEPSGFTKVSALGVEEQRVNVILDLPGPAGGEDVVLGDAYRVDVRIVVWEAPDVVKVPTSALVRDDEQWAVYVVEAGRARRRVVEIGGQNGREAEVLSGLAEGARVVIHPSDALRDGSRVRS
jgi:HlyD family secretion protein